MLTSLLFYHLIFIFSEFYSEEVKVTLIFRIWHSHWTKFSVDFWSIIRWTICIVYSRSFIQNISLFTGKRRFFVVWNSIYTITSTQIRFLTEKPIDLTEWMRYISNSNCPITRKEVTIFITNMRQILVKHVIIGCWLMLLRSYVWLRNVCFGSEMKFEYRAS